MTVPGPGGVDRGAAALGHVVAHVVGRAVAAADHGVVSEPATLGVLARERVPPLAARPPGSAPGSRSAWSLAALPATANGIAISGVSTNATTQQEREDNPDHDLATSPRVREGGGGGDRGSHVRAPSAP